MSLKKTTGFITLMHCHIRTVMNNITLRFKLLLTIAVGIEVSYLNMLGPGGVWINEKFGYLNVIENYITDD